MTISTSTVIDKVEVLQDGSLQIRQAQIITQNNVEINRNFTRWVRHPGDINAQTDPSPVPAIANATWTQEVISAYEASVASSKP